MNELEFSGYLARCSLSKKVVSDIISRVKRVESSILNLDIEREFEKDKCKWLLSLFKNSGDNAEMKKVHIGTLPVGKYSISTFSYAVRKYIDFLCEEK